MEATSARHRSAALSESVSAHRPYLMRFARQRLRDDSLVEDVVQDTLLAALQGIDGFAGKASLRTWLTGILLNRIADSLRRERALKAPASDAASESAGEEDTNAAAGADEPIDWLDPQRLVENRQFIEMLGGLLERMPVASARAFVLSEVEGMNTADIARELDVTPGNGALLVHRARMRLRQTLQQRGFAAAPRRVLN